MRPGKAAIDRIEQALLAEGPTHPHYERAAKEIWITDQPGRHFEVRARYEDGEMMVCAGDWHGHFDDGQEAFQCFMWLLTPYYRLVEVHVEDAKLCDRIERYDSGGWIDLGSVYYACPTDPETHALANRPTWRYVVWQHKLIEPEGGLSAILPDIELDENGLPPGSTLGRREFDAPPEDFDWTADMPPLHEMDKADLTRSALRRRQGWLAKLKQWWSPD